ncbi:MAG: Ig-like domain-containing protein [Bryobacteraceae bacterium]
MTFTAQAVNEVLSFFAVGTPDGLPPIVLLDGVSITPDAYIEVCKQSDTTNPLTAKDPKNYFYTLPGSDFSSPPGLEVPVGECSGAIPVAPVGGTATITELPTPGVGVSAITATGYSPSPFSQYEPDLVDYYSLQNGTATVFVNVPATPGDTSTETVVTYTNYPAPPGELKICKIGGTGVTGNFLLQAVNITNAGTGYTSAPTVTFTPGSGGCTVEPTAVATVSGGLVTGITLTSLATGCTPIPAAPLVTITGGGGTGATASAAVVSVEAGSPAENGYCQVVSGMFEVGTTGTVAENLVGGAFTVSGVTVNGAKATVADCGGNPGNPCVMNVIGPGINEVDFTNQQSGYVPPNPCPGCSFPCDGCSLPISTTALLTASDAAPVLGSPVTFAAAVTPGVGTVTFLDGSTPLGTATLNASGLAIYSTSTLALGAHSITASYAGNDAYGASTSNTVDVVVTQPSSQALLTAVPNPLVVLAPATVGTATLQWSAPAATTIELHVTSPDGPLLAEGGSSGSASTGTWVSDGMLFYLQDTTGGKPLSATNTLAVAAIAVRQQSSSFFAAPNPIPNAAGSVVSALGETTIQWDVPTVTNVEVHVLAPDGPLLVAGGPSGSAVTGLWVTNGMLFFLQDASSGNQLSPAATLATLNVYLQSQANSLLATPNPVVPSSGTALGATTIQWNAPNTTSVEVHVSAPNGTLFAAGGSSGTATTGQWVSDGTTFYLQDTTGGKPLTAANTLGVVLVHVQTGP